MIDGKLLLHEELLLLALDDETGKLLERAAPFALAGGLLGEMLFANRIELFGARPDVVVASREPLADPVLDQMFERVWKTPGRESLEWWVRDLAREPNLLRWTAEELCENGILRKRDAAILGMIPKKRFPTRDPGPECAVRKRIEEAVLGGATTVHERTVALVALAHSARLLRDVLSKEELDARMFRVDAMWDATELAPATDAAIRASKNTRTLACVLLTIAVSSG